MDSKHQEELKRLYSQLEQVKQRDRILEEIEKRLYKMKQIAQYTADHNLDKDETMQLEMQIRDHQKAISSLENYLI
ncbi:hypothetical protein [Sporosarcina sp. P33]|uniref:hypothetical protein n=1 Tax=Sporosarcina sp. P33 TaxID=1930764 RepID=UPI0009BDB3BB|nr:hypothetical protein [Sporosarcina sp. P33]ARD49046.1 hypothetical protein SporoP33_12905 [Sporosarcina sp. P33]